ncbi:MAG: TonB-dependent receptor, partial [Gemmatimonadota bacterium]
SNRIHSNVSSAIVLKNQNEGYAWNAAASLEKAFSGGFFAKAAYSYGISKNTVDPGSIASGSWFGNQHHGDPNNPGLGYSDNSPGHRFFVAASYRKNWLSFGGTSVSLFLEGRNNGNSSYIYGGDINGDGSSSNDLIYIARDQSEMNFEQYTQRASGDTPARTFTAAEQAAAWDAFIEQDPYLGEHRGEYAERNAVFVPLVWRADLSVQQELFRNISGTRNGLSIRADILNFTNFVNSDWGVGKRFITTSPLTSPGVDAQGRARYRLRNVNPTDSQHELITESFSDNVGSRDVYRMQVSLRYTFN